jgi:general secretion pathway protein F
LPTFWYKARRGDGEAVEGTIEAENEHEAAAALQKEVWLTELRPVAEQAAPRIGGKWSPWYALFPLPKSALAALFRQLASLFRAGVSAFQAISSVEDRVGSMRIRALLRKIGARVTEGQALSVSFREQEKAFGPFVPAMMEVGERTGRLDIVCDEIAEQYELEVSLARSVIVQKLYYGGLICLALILFPLINAWREYMLAKAKEQPQLVSEKLAAIGYTFLLAVAAIVALLLLLWVAKALMTIPWLAYARDAWRLYMPLSGGVVRRGAVARFCKTAGGMYEAGVPVAEAVEAAALAMNNRVLARRPLAQVPMLRQGGWLGQSVQTWGLFDPTMAGIIATGEQSGTLPEAFYQVAREYEQRRDSSRRVLIIGSVAVGLLAGAAVIVTVVVTFYLTYYNLMLNELPKAME